MTAEERNWYIERYKEEQEKRAKAEERAAGKSRVPSAARPSVRR